MAGSIFQQLYNTVDSLVVGNFLGDSALATVLLQGVSAVLCFVRLYRSQKNYGFDLSRIYPHKSTIKEILHLGVPSSFQNCMVALSNVVVQSGINLFETQAIYLSGYMAVEYNNIPVEI